MQKLTRAGVLGELSSIKAGLEYQANPTNYQSRLQSRAMAYEGKALAVTSACFAISDGCPIEPVLAGLICALSNVYTQKLELILRAYTVGLPDATTGWIVQDDMLVYAYRLAQILTVQEI